MSQSGLWNSHPELQPERVNTRDLPPETITSNTEREQHPCTACSADYNCLLPYWLAFHAISHHDYTAASEYWNHFQGQTLQSKYTPKHKQVLEVKKQQDGDLTSKLTLPSIYWIAIHSSQSPFHESAYQASLGESLQLVSILFQQQRFIRSSTLQRKSNE